MLNEDQSNDPEMSILKPRNDGVKEAKFQTKRYGYEDKQIQLSENLVR